MIISSSNVNMSSTRNYSKSIQAKTTVFKWTLDGKQQQVSSNSTSLTYKESSRYDSLSSAFLSYNRLGEETAEYDATSTQNKLLSTDSGVKANTITLRRTFLSLLEMLEKARFKNKFQDSNLFHELTHHADTSVLSLSSSANPQTWNRLEINSYFMEEKETTAFSTTGTAVTADGNSISFDVTMEMSSNFTESNEFCKLTQYQQILTDPLVINLDSNPTSVSAKTFLFDIDADGDKDEISQLSSGNGYLALDKNGDGIINDGKELFGPSTSNGFAELTAYDSDDSGWIDEADPVYQKLRVWTKDENGKDLLLSLKDADVGAIYLGSTKTKFSLTNDKNELSGRVQSTGMYLKESGGTGTVQQVDF